MTLSMYQAAVPVFVRALSNLQHVLRKGEAHAQARKFDTELLLAVRLSPDMLPLTRQVQIATDMAKNGCARLAGVDAPKFEDNETTFAQLYARLERTIQYIQSFKPAQIDGSETRPVTLEMRHGTRSFDGGQAYLLDFVIPNVFFHCTTAYNILRGAGVELGKADFLGKL